MSQQLELLTINGSSQWSNIILVAPEIQKKEIKPFLVLAVKELEGNPDSRTSSIVNVEKFSAIREVVRHFARLRSAIKEQWNNEDTNTFLEGLRFNPECVVELASLLCRDEIYKNVPKHLQTKPGLVSLHWKIDLSLSQLNPLAPCPGEHSKPLAPYSVTAYVTTGRCEGLNLK
ncbi:hypothetical protein EVAR_42477_1 [Eumeta japonica]|uniref:Uncharacterized protein n=1 Tax=Eumeta variegata TaxID=151549 RepID=A0A4C1XYK4_EUMVA|nr:hypothetical protein EVAR_42477_1 [Eumeta japonica]